MWPSRISGLQGRRVGIFGRGGAGKSTVAVLLARQLRATPHEVCILDADSCNEGLAEAAGTHAPPDHLLNWFGGAIYAGGDVTGPDEDPSPLPNALVDLRWLPIRYRSTSPEGVHVLTAGKVAHGGAGSDGPIAKIARDVVVHDGDEPMTMVIDFKAGLEDVSRGLLTGLDWAVVVVDPSFASLRLAMEVERIAARLREGTRPDLAHLDDIAVIARACGVFETARLRGVSYVINRVSRDSQEQVLRRQFEDLGMTVAAVMPDDDAIARCWLEGDAVDSYPAREAIEPLSRHLEDAFAPGHAATL